MGKYGSSLNSLDIDGDIVSGNKQGPIFMDVQIEDALHRDVVVADSARDEEMKDCAEKGVFISLPHSLVFVRRIGELCIEDASSQKVISPRLDFINSQFYRNGSGRFRNI